MAFVKNNSLLPPIKDEGRFLIDFYFYSKTKHENNYDEKKNLKMSVYLGYFRNE